MPASAREVALKCLLAGEKQGAWSDGYLRNAIRQAGLNGRDAALCTRLAYGVLQNRLLLDWHIDRLSTVPLEKLEPAVRGSMQIGLYQLLFLTRVPVHAAVNEAVALTKRYSRNPRSGGLVNGVLRTFDRERTTGVPVPEELSVRYSHPQWLVDEFARSLPASELEVLLEADNGQPAVQAQVNTLKTTTEDLIQELERENVTVVRHPWLADCLELEGTGNLEDLPAFQEGRFYVQDAAARMAVMAAEIRPGMAVLDACAAPGGKSYAAAMDMKGDGRIFSCDIHPHKQTLIEKGAARLGIGCITAATMDAKRFDPALEKRFDVVLTDVPCSGLGIIRKKPDIRYKDPKPLENLPAVQKEIIANAARYVREGGVLLYATCTVLQRENEEVVKWFLGQNEAFSLESMSLPGPVGVVDGMVTLWPHRHGTDGFFFAKLRRRA